MYQDKPRHPHADSYTAILSSCIVNISSHYIGFSCCKQYLKIKNDDFILICTFDGLGIFHLKSSNFEGLNSTFLPIQIIFAGLIYFCLNFTKIKAISVTMAGITMSITAWVWVTPAVVVLESLSITGSISSLATGHWMPPGL